MHVYYKLKANMPAFFADRNPMTSKDVRHAFEILNIIALPSTPKNNFVLYYGLANFEPRNYYFDETVKLFMMVAGCESIT